MTDDRLPQVALPPNSSVSNVSRYSMSARRASLSLNVLAGRRSMTGTMARAYKLAQYFRMLPCQYSEQVFCFAGCLLKWFQLEAMRQEAYAATMVKSPHHGDRGHAAAGPAQGTQDPPMPKASFLGSEDAAVPDSDSHNNANAAVDSLHQGVSLRDDSNEVDVASRLEISVAMEPDAEPNQATDEQKAERLQGEEARSQFSAEGNETVPEIPIYGSVTRSPLLKIVYSNARERRDTYRLAFNAMKYYGIIEKLLDEITFYMEYPELRDEEFLILVLVYDYAMRNFQRRTTLPHERSLPDLERYMEYLPNNRLVMYPPGAEIFKNAEAAVQAMCMRLAAAVARVRVRNQVGSLRLLLPEEWRQFEGQADTMPTYGWYNQLLGKQDIVTGWLKDHGFRRIVAGRLPQQGEYGSDKHCSDVFVFNKADVSTLLDSEVVLQRNLVLQDKSSCLGVHCMLANVAGGEEVLFVNCINVYSAVHMEGLIGNKFPLIQPVPQIRCVRPLKEDEDPRLTVKMGSKVIKATNEEFLSMEYHGEKNKSIRHIYIEASDSRSGVINPVGFLEVECDDLNILRDMWTPSGNAQKETRRSEMVNKTASLLRHALKFSGVRTVTLLSHSVDTDETDALVTRVVEITNRTLLKEAEAIAASSRGTTTGTAFNLQLPVFPGLQEEREAFEAGKPSIITKNKTIYMQPSQETNGFAIYILNKETVLLKSLDELKQDAEYTGRAMASAKGKGKGKKR